jgi:hypothetical protein
MQPPTAKPPNRTPRWRVSARMQPVVLAGSLVASARRTCP